MSKPQVVTQAEIERYRSDIRANGVAGVIRTYDALLEKGYDYAGWAKGVAEAQGISETNWFPDGSITGRAAVLYLKKSSGQDISEEKLNRIREGMAQGYLKFLETNIKNNVVKDVDFKSMRDFHREVFERNGLSINNWTLETPMKLIGKYEGEAERERKWEELRKTQGTKIDALWGSVGLHGAVSDYADGYINVNKLGRRTESHENNGVIGGVSIPTKVKIDPLDKREAEQWLNHVDRVKPLLYAQNQQQINEKEYTVAQSNVGQGNDLKSLVEQMKTGSFDPSRLDLTQLVMDNQAQMNTLKNESIEHLSVLNKHVETMTAQTQSVQEMEPETRSRGRSL